VLGRDRSRLAKFGALLRAGLLCDPVQSSCAGKLDSDPCGENALELQPGPFDWNDTVSFIIQPDDRISVDILRLADEFVYNEFTPIVLEWCAIRDLVAWRLCEACLDVEAASIMLFE